jgi:K+-transporting ATPase ATPase C chain
MRAHLRANLFLLIFTLLFCSVLYPLVVLSIGQIVFPHKARGSLIEVDGKTVGSELIAQPFHGDEYFQPRPSAANYNGAASSASNLGASNYQLRERVAQTLGPIVKFGTRHARAGELVGPAVEQWLHDHPQAVAAWQTAHPDAPSRWLLADPGNAKIIKEWKKEGEPTADDVVPFFESLAAKSKRSADEQTAVQSVFFESWRDAYPDDDLELVPADMVMSSGSGLDPHITLKNALYQLDRVVEKWVELTGGDKPRIKGEIEKMLDDKVEQPLGGLVGEKLINVLQINLALHQRYDKERQATQ